MSQWELQEQPGFQEKFSAVPSCIALHIYSKSIPSAATPWNGQGVYIYTKKGGEELAFLFVLL